MRSAPALRTLPSGGDFFSCPSCVFFASHLVTPRQLRQFAIGEMRDEVFHDDGEVCFFQGCADPLQDCRQQSMTDGDGKLLACDALAFLGAFPLHLLRRRSIPMMHAAVRVGADLDDPPPSSPMFSGSLVTPRSTTSVRHSAIVPTELGFTSAAQQGGPPRLQFPRTHLALAGC